MQTIPLFMHQAVVDKLKTWIKSGIIKPVKPGTRLEWLSSINPVEKAPNNKQNQGLLSEAGTNNSKLQKFE